MPSRHNRIHHAKIAREMPQCPSCGCALENLRVTQCLYCQFDMARARALFPFEAPVLKPLMDNSKLFSPRDAHKAGKIFCKITRLFPQLRICLCSVRLPPAADPRVFGFWMLNQCRFAEDEEITDRLHTLLLLIDTQEKRLSASTGFSIEPYLPDSELAEALRQSYSKWFNGNPLEATKTFALLLLSILKKSQNLARKRLKEFSS